MDKFEKTFKGEGRIRAEKIEAASRAVVAAWDALEGGRHYRPREVEEWLVNEMAPAVKRLRKEFK